MQIYSDEEIEAQGPPSRPGFESEAERSAQAFEVPFLPTPAPSAPFPATLIQDHRQLDMQRIAAGAQTSGVSSRVNNIVRAFSIRGALDRDLLSQALNFVANLHPIIAARFQRTRERLYMQVPNSECSSQRKPMRMYTVVACSSQLHGSTTCSTSTLDQMHLRTAVLFSAHCFIRC